MNEQQGAGAPTKKLVRIRIVQDRSGLCRASIYNRMNPKSPQYDSTFPKPISLGGRAVGWLESEVEAWIDAKVRARSRQNKSQCPGEQND